jgi:hypothetical protein
VNFPIAHRHFALPPLVDDPIDVVFVLFFEFSDTFSNDECRACPPTWRCSSLQLRTPALRSFGIAFCSGQEPTSLLEPALATSLKSANSLNVTHTWTFAMSHSITVQVPQVMGPQADIAFPRPANAEAGCPIVPELRKEDIMFGSSKLGSGGFGVVFQA